MEEVDDFSRRFITARDYLYKNGLCPDCSEESKDAIEKFEECVLLSGTNIEDVIEIGRNVLNAIILEDSNDEEFNEFFDGQYYNLSGNNINTHPKILDQLIIGALYSESLKINDYIGIHSEIQLISNLSKCTGYIHGALDILRMNSFASNYISSEIEIDLTSELISKYKKEVIKSLATKGAASRHKEARSCKEDVFRWADENMKAHRSLDAAALAIADQLVPYKFRTVRQWLTEWKKLRSAGTA